MLHCCRIPNWFTHRFSNTKEVIKPTPQTQGTNEVQMDEESNNTVRFEEFKEKETVGEESIKVALYNPEENQIVSETVDQGST